MRRIPFTIIVLALALQGCGINSEEIGELSDSIDRFTEEFSTELEAYRKYLEEREDKEEREAEAARIAEEERAAAEELARLEAQREAERVAQEEEAARMAAERANDLKLVVTGGLSSGSSRVTAIVNGVLTQVNRQSVVIANWGYWGKKADDTLFRAGLTASGTITNGVPSQSFSSRVTGPHAGSNPVSGSATWTGGVRGVTEGFVRVIGTSTLEADLSAATIDVLFSAFDDGRADMSWSDLDVVNGAFADGSRLNGAFYGENHDGAAGKFDRDNLRGVFGAIRE